MRISTTGLATIVFALGACVPFRLGAQTVAAPATPGSIILTNGVSVGTSTAVTPRDIAPNLASSNMTPAIGRQGITPAQPPPGTPGIQPGLGTRGFTTGIGRQGFGGAIGQQGSGTAIGQQGSGTAIGQQGVGTAIIPGTNGVVIGQPEPFTPAPPTVLTPTGRNNPGQTGAIQRTFPLANPGVTSTPPAMARPPLTPIKPGTTPRR